MAFLGKMPSVKLAWTTTTPADHEDFTNWKSNFMAKTMHKSRRDPIWPTKLTVFCSKLGGILPIDPDASANIDNKMGTGSWPEYKLSVLGIISSVLCIPFVIFLLINQSDFGVCIRLKFTTTKPWAQRVFIVTEYIVLSLMLVSVVRSLRLPSIHRQLRNAYTGKHASYIFDEDAIARVRYWECVKCTPILITFLTSTVFMVYYTKHTTDLRLAICLVYQVYFATIPTLIVFNFFVYCESLTAGFAAVNGKLKNILRPDFEDLENICHYGPKEYWHQYKSTLQTIRSLSITHCHLYDTVAEVHAAYQVQMFLIVTWCCFRIYLTLKYIKAALATLTWESPYLVPTNTAHCIILLLTITLASSRLSTYAERAKEILTQIDNKHLCEKSRHEAFLFLRSITNRSGAYDVCGAFELRPAIVYSIVVWCFYLVFSF